MPLLKMHHQNGEKMITVVGLQRCKKYACIVVRRKILCSFYELDGHGRAFLYRQSIPKSMLDVIKVKYMGENVCV